MTQSSNFYSNQREPGDCSYMTDRGGERNSFIQHFKDNFEQEIIKPCQ